MNGARFRNAGAGAGAGALMLDWAARKGWNPGLADAEAFGTADPGGFFVAEVDGAPVAAISVVIHSDEQAFLGLDLCLPEYRGKGIGYGLWSHALAHAGDRTIGLDGVPQQEANYARSGFVLAGRTRQLAGRLPDAVPHLPLAQAVDHAALIGLDAAANGFARSDFMTARLRNSDTRTTILARDATAITGFATARLCRAGAKIGPVIAPDAEAALDLAAEAAAAIGWNEVMIDVPDSAEAFGARLRDLGFTEGFATSRMYRGPRPVTDGRLHAVATLELG